MPRSLLVGLACTLVLAFMASAFQATPTTRAVNGTVAQVNAKDMTVVVDNKNIKFVLTPSTIKPKQSLNSGQRVRVLYIEADVKVATEIQVVQ